MEKNLKYILSIFLVLTVVGLSVFVITKTENNLWTAQLLTPTTYYIDNTAGNDANAGTSADQAWKTVAKVNNSTFQPGDQILFKRGGIWREQLSISSSGIQGDNITFGAYGSGAKPIITGADTVNNWTLYNDNIYVADVGNITPPNQLYVDGVYYDVAHYPNSGYLITTANSLDATSIIDANLTLSADQIVGATVIVKKMHYTLTSVATAYNPATRTITLNPPLNSNLKANFGFYLQNKFWMLDSPKEWYYDPTAGKIYIWTASGDNPNSHTVEISDRLYGVYNSGKNYVTIQDLAISNASQYNVIFNNATGINVNNLNISGGLNGIYFNNISNSSINNNSIQNALVDGIDANYQVTNIDILNNTINNAGNIGMPRTSYASIFVGKGSKTSAESINIKNNTITNSGYIGIMFFGNLIVVQDNKVDRSCLVLQDCGGIYTSSYQNIGGTIQSNNTIIGNTVTNTMGNVANGIYLDGVTYNTSVLNNTVISAQIGIFSNDGYNNTISGNKIHKARWTALGIASGSFAASIAVGGLAKNNIIKNNIFDGDGIYYVVYLQNGAQNQAIDFGTFNNNKYCHPNTKNNVVFLTNVKGQPSDYGYNPNNRLTAKGYTLSKWQTESGQDIDSTDIESSCYGESPPAPIPTCGDENCNGSETCSSCLADCGACPPPSPPPPPPPPICGDGNCNGSETCSSCLADCGACPPPSPPPPIARSSRASCYPRWQCGDKGACISSKQKITCVDLNRCSATKTIELSCATIEETTQLSPIAITENETPSATTSSVPESKINFLDFLNYLIKTFFQDIFKLLQF